MKLLVLHIFVSVATLFGQTQSRDWIDLENKSDSEIIRILVTEIAALAESPAAEATERINILEQQEKSTRQSFEQKTALLQSELTAAAITMEAAEKVIADFQADSTMLISQIELYDRSRERLRERLDKFPFKAVVLAKAGYAGNLEPVKEMMIQEAGRLAIEEINGVQIISETLVQNSILVSEVIQANTRGRADFQPREWKTLENGTQRVIYLYGICDVYPLAESYLPPAPASPSQISVEAHVINAADQPWLANLPANMQQDIRVMVGIVGQANEETQKSLAALAQHENTLLQSSGVREDKRALQNKLDALKSSVAENRRKLAANRQVYQNTRQKFWDHLNSEQRIEIITQSDLERNRSDDAIKSKLVADCVTQFRTTVKSLYSQEKQTVAQSQLVSNESANMFEQVRLKAGKILGIYLSPSEGDIKYTASVAFRFGFEYVMPREAVANADPKGGTITPSFRFRSTENSLSEQNVKAMLAKLGFFDARWNKDGKGIQNQFEVLRSYGAPVVIDHATGLMWQQIGSPNYLDLYGAEEYITRLNADGFGGFQDWRLPTLEEAMSLVESKPMVGDFYIDPVFFREQERIWTSDRSSAAEAWVVTFRYGVCGSSPLDGRYFVRAVR